MRRDEPVPLNEAQALEPEMEMVNNLWPLLEIKLRRPAASPTSTIVNGKIFAANSAADSLIAY